MVTRRCSQRTFRLAPSEETNAIWIFCLGLAAERSGVRICAVCVMSNHYHAVVFDPEGNISVFVHVLHRLVAKCLNALQGQRENLWSNDRPNLLLLGDEDDVIAKIAYLTANPVEAGLVPRPEEWPGVMLLPKGRGYRVRARRPEVYFGKRSSAPEEVELEIVTAPFEGFLERVEAAIEERVAQAHRRAREEKRGFLGAAAVRKTSFVKKARSLEKMWKRIPEVAAMKPELREAMKADRREFLVAYYEALERWRNGERDVVFPWGTWWMRVHHGAAVA
jgi:REP element-mobilizing transposase RayT